MAAAAAALVILAGCGGGGKDAGRTTTTKFSYGSNLAADASTTTTVAGRPGSPATTAAPGGGSAAGGAPSAGTTPAGSKALNQSNRDDAGLHLTLTVGGDLDYTSSESIDMELTVRNTSKATKYYDPNARPIFGIGPERGGEPNWQDDDCRVGQNTGDEIQGGAIELPPNDDVRLQADYPGRGPDRAKCRLPAGTYVAFATFPLCPEGPTPSGPCDPAKVTRLPSAPVRITIH